MQILVVDVGGNNVKLLVTGQEQPLKLHSGPTMTPGEMVAMIRQATADWNYDVVSIGYPGPVKDGSIQLEPRPRLRLGRIRFRRRIRQTGAAHQRRGQQALGGYESCGMLFLGLGTGLGSAFIINKMIAPLELAHLPYKKGRSFFEDYVGKLALARSRQEAVATVRRGRRVTAAGSHASRFHPAGRRQREETDPAARPGSPGRQPVRVSGRVPSLDRLFDLRAFQGGAAGGSGPFCFRPLGVYGLAALGGSVLSYLFSNPRVEGVGASGAIFGLFGAFFVIAKIRRTDTGGIFVIIVINLVLSFADPLIDWRAHVGGLVVGTVVAGAFALAETRPPAQRRAIEVGASVAVLVVLIGLIGLRTSQLRA